MASKDTAIAPEHQPKSDMRPRWGFLLFLLMLGALLLAGCQETVPIGGKPRTKRYQKVISLSPSTTEIIGINFGPPIFAGRTEACNYPTVAKVPIVAGVKPNYEMIAKIKPDLVVYDKSLYSEADIAKIKQISGADIFELSADTIDQQLDFMYRLGSSTGTEVGISEYADKVLAARDRARGVAPSPKPRVAVLMADAGSEYMGAGTGSFQADVVNASGGDPIGPEGNRFVPVNVEMLVSLNPDVIIVSGDPEVVLKDQRLASTNAIKNKRVARVNPDVLLRAGYRVDQLIRSLSNFFGQQPGQ